MIVLMISLIRPGAIFLYFCKSQKLHDDAWEKLLINNFLTFFSLENSDLELVKVQEYV